MIIIGVFLQSEFSAKDDLKLLGQVEFWSLNRRILDLFGSDVQSAVEEERLNELQRMDDLIDRWYQDWQVVLDSAGLEDNTSKCFLAFYTHSAKLYLYSHAFRGRADTDLRAERTALDIQQIAGDNALAILRSTMDIAENIRLETLPSYFGTMIAYASVCIIRTLLDEASRPRSGTQEALRLMREVSQTILDRPLHDRSHTLLSIATSLRRAIKQQDQAIQTATNPPNYDAGPDLSFDFDFGLFVSEQNGMTFPAYEDFWLPCPDEMPEMAL